MYLVPESYGVTRVLVKTKLPKRKQKHMVTLGNVFVILLYKIHLTFII